MTNNEKYLLHCSGLYTLMGWLRELELIGAPCTHREDEIILNPIVARRFGLGFAKGKYTSNKPFFAIQPNEHKWMKLIRWDKLYIRKSDPNLYFVSKAAAGDQAMFPDMPAFTFTVPLDHKEKLDLFDEIDKLEARELTFTEDGDMNIDFTSKLFTISVKILDEEEPLPEKEKALFNSYDVVLKKEAYAMGTESTYKFVGDANTSSSQWQEYQKQLESIKKDWLK